MSRIHSNRSERPTGIPLMTLLTAIQSYNFLYINIFTRLTGTLHQAQVMQITHAHARTKRDPVLWSDTKEPQPGFEMFGCVWTEPGRGSVDRAFRTFMLLMASYPSRTDRISSNTVSCGSSSWLRICRDPDRYRIASSVMTRMRCGWRDSGSAVADVWRIPSVRLESYGFRGVLKAGWIASEVWA